MAKMKVKMAPDGAAEVRRGWRPKGVKKLDTMAVTCRTTGAEMVINASDFDAAKHEVPEKGSAPAPAPDVPEFTAQAPAAPADPIELAKLRVTELRELDAFKRLPAEVREGLTTKNEIVNAIINGA